MGQVQKEILEMTMSTPPILEYMFIVATGKFLSPLILLVIFSYA